MFIKLTGKINAAPMYFNIDNIVMICVNPDNTTYIVTSNSENDESYIVKESTEQIISLIHESKE